jgi:AcrR family transcriptional regulator
MSEDEIKAAVVEEGRKRFLSIGIAGTQMNLIARSVGISRSTLYLYFPSKVELVFTVSRALMDFISRGVAQHVASAGCASGFDEVHAHLSYLLNYYKENANVARFFDEFDAIYSGDYPDVEETRRYASDMAEHMKIGIHAQVARGQADGSIRGDMDTKVLGSILIDGLYGMIQRIFPRKTHIEQEHNVSVSTVSDLFLTFLENEIKSVP